jgi:hypothetical protein
MTDGSSEVIAATMTGTMPKAMSNTRYGAIMMLPARRLFLLDRERDTATLSL